MLSQRLGDTKGGKVEEKEVMSGAANTGLGDEDAHLTRWAGVHSEINRYIHRLSRQCLDAYRANPLLVTEHANIERATAQGGYGRRQLYELVQNGADALLGHRGGKVQVLLTDTVLYCANEGEPMTTDGVDAILSSHISNKRGAEIGRFGMGFKSVLGVTSRPEFYSRTGSFSFDGEDAERRIREIVPDSDRFPTLRLARPLDPYAAAHEDPILAKLMKWASTVVRLPRELVSSEWLSQDISNFPAGFLLFSPHVGKLILEDRVRSVLREIRVSAGERLISLEEDGTSSVWQVFEQRYIPTDSARKDAGELADRESLPIMWAVPLEGRAASARGQFWAFFPTEYYTTLSGIVNAPWKTNEDRQNLLKGVFNEELIDATARLIADKVSLVEASGDPGRFLDLMPARGREAPNWADAQLTEKVYKYAAEAPIVPDQNGKRHHASELHLHPDGLPAEALEIWAGYPGRPPNWCHHSVDKRERRSRIERLYGLSRPAKGLAPWLEALVQDRTPESSLAAVRAAVAVLKSPNATSANKDDIVRARIVLTRDNIVERPKPGALFLPSSTGLSQSDVVVVHDALAASEEGRSALLLLGIAEVDASSELKALIASNSLAQLMRDHPEEFWQLIGRVPMDTAATLLKSYFGSFPQLSVPVRTIGGGYRPMRQTLLPGDVVPADGSRDADVAIDTDYHASTLTLLIALGAVKSPTPDGGSPHERWFAPYRQFAIQQLNASLTGRRVPQERYLIFDRHSTTGPLEPLYLLSDDGRVRFTDRLMLAAVDEPDWTLYHETRRDYYPDQKVLPPAVYVAFFEGRLQTSLGIRNVYQAVGPALGEWKRVFPVAQNCENERWNRYLTNSVETLKQGQWDAAFEAAKSLDDERFLGRFYALAARHVAAPAEIRCRKGGMFTLLPPARVAVAHDPAEIGVLVRSAIPFLEAAASDAVALCQKWQLHPATDLVSISVSAAPSGPEVPLVDRFPGLAAGLGENRQSLTLIPCSSVRLDTTTKEGQKGEDRPLLRSGEVLYYLDSLDNAGLLDQVCGNLAIELAPSDREGILAQRELNESRQRVLEVRTNDTLAGKMLAAVGAAALRRRLPVSLLSAVEQEHGPLSDLKLAELALAVYGVETLHEFRDELARAKLSPPVQWAASYTARQFVQQLGFPKAYAGFQESRRDAVLEVDGPSRLPKLHSFQEAIVKRIDKLLSEGAPSRRGLLSLPTGAGKTRVAVESLIRAAAGQRLNGPILWIAQTDELCEQAVQTWSEVWRAYGPRRRLHINRLWASNDADLYDSGTQVVVATDAKLTAACIGNPLYDWLTEVQCVVIDEAHISTAPSYTAILEWLGFSPKHEPCPLIGLTATPFKGGEDPTRFLAGRYGRYRFDAGVLGDEPYAKLQQMGVLARVEHRVLDGATYEVSEKELRELKMMKSLPASVADKIGADASRNKVLLDHIRGLDAAWPVLLFAASVDHARTMAALLSAEGISAAAVSAATDPGARRYYVEQFRRGRLRVLANYAVLTTGFDAPSIRALYVARPTYSPAAYQQMIGRGLRGPLNGGKDCCMIVNVRDNILQFGEELAFTQFEHIWSK